MAHRNTGPSARSFEPFARNARGLFLVLWWGLTVSTLPMHAQEALFFSLQGAGSASLVLDKAKSTAYLTDGGNPGKGGIGPVKLHDRPLLEALSGEVSRLVVTCTHPHRDHFGGLANLLKTEAIQRFEELVLIDAPQSYGEGKSLREVYEARWGPCPDASPFDGKCRYVSAENQDAFARLGLDGGSVKVSNFEYDPELVGKDAHDRTLIVRYELENEAGKTSLVDFDDASSALIRHWSDQNSNLEAEGLEAGVVVMPHHGSRRNDIRPVLDSGFGVRQVVFTTNRRNRFDHPSPEILEEMIRRLGAENVFITDSVPGRSIRVTPEGVAYDDGTPPTRALALFIDGRLEYLAERQAKIEEDLRASPELDPDTRAVLDAGGWLSLRQQKDAETAGLLSSFHRRRLQSGYDGTRILSGIRDVMGPTSVAEHLAEVSRSRGLAAEGSERLVPAAEMSLGKETWSGQIPEVWRVAFGRGDLAAVAFLPAEEHTASVCPAGDSACALAESWSGDGSWIVYGPESAGTIESLVADMESRGLRAYFAGAVGENVPGTYVGDKVLTSTLISEASRFWVLSSDAVRAAVAQGCPWTCAAMLTIPEVSPALERYRQKQGK